MRVQIGIDDLSPRPTQSFELWHNVEKLLDADLKVDLFVTFAMIRDGDGPYSIQDFPDFINRLRDISNHKNITLNVHGFFHSASSRNNNDEFLYVPKPELDKRLTSIGNTIKNLDLNFKKVFRPPAWKISQDGVNLLIDHGYTHLSLMSGSSYLNKWYDKLDLSKIKVHWCNSSPPDVPLQDGDLSATYHFSTHLKNALTGANVEELLQRLNNPEPYHIFET
tara:strand:+ start:243 stop:908 length:666 start_codon:yes stop_codon:yes gene_type:complete